MQFTLRIHGEAPDLAAISRELATLDPAALVDIDARGQAVRIATSATEIELRGSLRRAGVTTAPHDLTQLPSECCGGCGG
jgi:hypothetical protein